MPLSVVAWQRAPPEWRSLLEPAPWAPWTLTSAGAAEARRCHDEIARTKKPAYSLREREDHVLREAMMFCFGIGAWWSLLDELQRFGRKVSGVLPTGSRVVIDDQLLRQLRPDLASDTATTWDRQQTWRALALEPEPSAPAAAPPPRVTMVDAAIEWYRLAYPDGHPPGLKLDQLAHQAAERLGRTCSTRTMRRAIVEARRTKAAK